jgi:hypothetical protein
MDERVDQTLKLIILANSDGDTDVTAALTELLRTTWHIFNHNIPLSASLSLSLSTVNTITNLFNCVLSPELLVMFEEEEGQQQQLLLGAQECAGCADPLAYEAACVAHAHRQLLRTSHLDANAAERLLAANPDIKLLYAVDAKTACEELSDADSLLRQDTANN